MSGQQHGGDLIEAVTGTGRAQETGAAFCLKKSRNLEQRSAVSEGFNIRRVEKTVNGLEEQFGMFLLVIDERGVVLGAVVLPE